MADGTARDFLSEGYRSRREQSRRRRSTRMLWILGAVAFVLVALALLAVFVVVPALRPPVFTEQSLYSTLARPDAIGLVADGDSAVYEGFLSPQEQRDEAGMFVAVPESGADACTEYQYGDWLISSTQPESSATDIFTTYQLTATDAESFGTAARLFSDEDAARSYRHSLGSALSACISAQEGEAADGALAEFPAGAVPLSPVVSIKGGGADGEATTVQAHVQRGNVVVVVWLWYLDRPEDSMVIDDLTAAVTVFQDADPNTPAVTGVAPSTSGPAGSSPEN